MAKTERHERRQFGNYSPTTQFSERIRRWYGEDSTQQDYQAILGAIRERIKFGNRPTSFTDPVQRLYSGEEGQVWRVVRNSKVYVVLTGKSANEMLVPLPADCVTEEVAENGFRYFLFHGDSINLYEHRMSKLPIDFDNLNLSSDRE